MEITKLNRSVKKLLRQNLEKQKKFNNRYAITEKPQSYDSFTDPHCSYYFNSQTVKSNVKHLKKAIAHERNSSDKKKLQLLIRQRNELNTKLSSIFKRRSYSSKTEDINSKQLLKQTLGSLSLFYKSKKQQQSQQDFNKYVASIKARKINTLPQQNKRYNEQSLMRESICQIFSLNPKKNVKMKNSSIHQQEYSNRLAQTLHKKKRMKWIHYLQERKNALLQKNRFQTLNQKASI